MNKIVLEHEIKIDKDGEYLVECIDNDIEVEILSNCCVNLYIMIKDKDINSNIHFILNENSKLNVNKFYCCGDVNEKIIIDLNGKNSSIDYRFAGISRKNEKYDIKINHNNIKTKSNVSNHLITLENAKINFNIDSIVKKGNILTIMNQDTKVITKDNNNVIIHPNMYIDEMNVSAKHSSVIGYFKEEEIFYLLSKGINYNITLKLLIKGFLISSVDSNMLMRAYILDIINKYWR